MVLHRELDLLLSPTFADPTRGDGAKSSGMSIEKKIEFLESLTGKVTNRRSRRWLNDRLLMELVPRLNAEEIRGLFAPPPWGDEVPPSTFSMANVEEWDRFRNIDMDKEVNIIHTLENSLEKRKGHIDADKMAVLNGWRRVGCRTREALRRSSLFELIESYEECVRAFITESTDGDVLELQIRDPFHRLLLHGVCEVKTFCSGKASINGLYPEKKIICILPQTWKMPLVFHRPSENALHTKHKETKIFSRQTKPVAVFERGYFVYMFYNLASDTVTDFKGMESSKMTRIKKKKRGSPELPKITLTHFLRMSKEGSW